jgi:hypothetical protein
MKATVCICGEVSDLTLASIKAQSFTDYGIAYDTLKPSYRSDCLNNAETDYLVFVNSGDILAPDYLQKIVERLDADPIYGAVFSHFSLIDAEGKDHTDPHWLRDYSTESNQTQAEWLKMLYCGLRLRGPVAYRRSLNIGIFDESLTQFQELEFYIRILKKAPIYVIQEKLSKVKIPEPDDLDKYARNLGIIQRRHYRKNTGVAKRKLLIATPFYEMKGWSPYIKSIVATATYLTKAGIDFEYLDWPGDSYVDRARNTICARFLESDCTHLFLLDSDEQWNPEPIVKMLEADKEVLGGAYPTKNNWENYSSISLTQPPTIENGLVKASVVSAGFMMIKREALEKFEAHYPDLSYIDQSADPPDNKTRIYIAFFECFRQAGLRHGEDYTFCNRWRAMGGELWIYPDIDFGHFGVQGWFGNFAKYLKK